MQCNICRNALQIRIFTLHLYVHYIYIYAFWQMLSHRTCFAALLGCFLFLFLCKCMLDGCVCPLRCSSCAKKKNNNDTSKSHVIVGISKNLHLHLSILIGACAQDTFFIPLCCFSIFSSGNTQQIDTLHLCTHVFCSVSHVTGYSRKKKVFSSQNKNFKASRQGQKKKKRNETFFECISMEEKHHYAEQTAFVGK